MPGGRPSERQAESRIRAACFRRDVACGSARSRAPDRACGPLRGARRRGPARRRHRRPSPRSIAHATDASPRWREVRRRRASAALHAPDRDRAWGGCSSGCEDRPRTSRRARPPAPRHRPRPRPRSAHRSVPARRGGSAREGLRYCIGAVALKRRAMRVLITGGAGFIGSTLALALAERTPSGNSSPATQRVAGLGPQGPASAAAHAGRRLAAGRTSPRPRAPVPWRSASAG